VAGVFASRKALNHRVLFVDLSWDAGNEVRFSIMAQKQQRKSGYQG